MLGPHLFTIDERNWVDAERELPVVVPEPFAAIVRTDAPVRVTGVVQKVPIAKIQQDWNILSSDPKIKAEIETRPVLVAKEVVAAGPGGLSLRVRTGEPVGTSGTGAAGATGTAGADRSARTVTDPAEAARSTDKSLVGRRVDLKARHCNDETAANTTLSSLALTSAPAWLGNPFQTPPRTGAIEN